jgi:hypothetical protein
MPVQCRPLSIGLPSRDAALQAQKDNLLRFVQEQHAAYAELPYLPWTDQRVKFGVPTQLCASNLPGCAGLRGVELVRELRTEHREVPLVYYPGLLMTDRMYQQFNQRYHCPTGLGLPVLNFVDPSGKEVEVLIVGDPTSHGAIINDGKRSGHTGQCWCSSIACVWDQMQLLRHRCAAHQMLCGCD